MVTIKDIAIKAGVSKSTVSKYINGGSVKGKNAEKIGKAIDEMGYRPNIIAQGLKTRKSYTIGVLVPYLQDIFASTIISTIEKKVREFGYLITVASYQEDSEEFKDKLRFYLDKMVDAVIVFPWNLKRDDFNILLEYDIPFVLVDRKILGIDKSCILIDNRDICYKAVRHLCEQGHRKIAVLTGDKNSYTAKQRAAGCKEAFDEFGIKEDEYSIIYGDFTKESGYENGKNVLKDKREFTAIFATNYYLTNGVLKSFNEKQINVPEDISFIGFDNLGISDIYRPSLTMVVQPMKAIGEKCSEVVIDILVNNKKDTQTIFLPGSIIEGESIKKIN